MSAPAGGPCVSPTSVPAVPASRFLSFDSPTADSLRLSEWYVRSQRCYAYGAPAARIGPQPSRRTRIHCLSDPESPSARLQLTLSNGRTVFAAGGGHSDLTLSRPSTAPASWVQPGIFPPPAPARPLLHCPHCLISCRLTLCPRCNAPCTPPLRPTTAALLRRDAERQRREQEEREEAKAEVTEGIAAFTRARRGESLTLSALPPLSARQPTEELDGASRAACCDPTP